MLSAWRSRPPSRFSSDSSRRSSSITCSATVRAPIAGPAPRAWPASANTSTSNHRTPMPATRRRRSVGSRSRAASPTIPARIEASVPFPLCSSSIAPTTVTGGSAPGSAARSASIARVAIASPDFMSPAPRPTIQPSWTRGAKGGDDHSRSSPAGTTSRWPFRMRRRSPSAAEPADDDRAPGVRPGADARHRIELDAVREGTRSTAMPTRSSSAASTSSAPCSAPGTLGSRTSASRNANARSAQSSTAPSMARSTEWCLGWAISPKLPRPWSGVGARPGCSATEAVRSADCSARPRHARVPRATDADRRPPTRRGTGPSP